MNGPTVILAISAGVSVVATLLNRQDRRKFRFFLVSTFILCSSAAVTFNRSSSAIENPNPAVEALRVEISAARPGDLIFSNNQLFVVVRAESYGDDTLLRYYEVGHQGGEPNGWRAKFFAERSARLIRMGTPEYATALSSYFEEEWRPRRH